ncbi:serine/threonine-protein kinase-like protein [Heracleum sosnowskyi]|uniref:Serine/threonine-protein kinase-like protein n=1 Tax=Heracleum sosnowskyi TaxID=360622 RepID=A0AAD8JN02_9APIA|nr:serine/threonine-protein kinase-like protein [Heracleum sosnowskyi]
MGYLSSCNADSSVSISTCIPSSNQTIPNNFRIKHLSYSMLHSSTNAFSSSNFLGKGSQSSVYKASLYDGKLIAAVKLTSLSSADNEIEILSRIRSPRIVNLLGFSIDSNNRRLIVVEFMPNGNLHDLLHVSNSIPSWNRRLRLAIQIAKGVAHLHSLSPPVIHRDIKSSNVLIDVNRSARLSDFGLALRGHVDDARVKCTPPAGTFGYLDPCYLAPCDLSTKSDVFSFGILLLEIISGRKAIDMSFSPPSVVDWALPIIKSGDHLGICDRRIKRPENEAVVREIVNVAAKCVRSKAEKRPDMTEVVQWLKAARKGVFSSSSTIWSSLGWRVGCSPRRVMYEALEERKCSSSSTSDVVKASRGGNRRNRKVSSVELEIEASGSGLDLDLDSLRSRSGRVRLKSKSIGSINEIEIGLLDENVVRKKLGLGLNMTGVTSVRGLRKSRSTSVLQGRQLVENDKEEGIEKNVKRANNRELEVSKLLIDSLGKQLKKLDY